MRVLEFKIDGQKLQRVGDFSHVARGTKNYLCCKFTFVDDVDWRDCVLVAAFENQYGVESAVLVGDDLTCLIPDDITDSKYFKIRLIGAADKKRITTNKELISQEG